MAYAVHELKTWLEYYQAVVDGRKPFEIRLNDRNYQIGDVLFLREFEPNKGIYTGRNITREVTYTLKRKPFVPDGYIVMGIKPWDGDLNA
ncbi:MAG: hypothetical protein AWM53_02000 [Candidatus Dichloromethanomonas elyunquensis]|nr:MAG: hypothetical protein AWM53_02000 [Candidatus Dichloromethanomonas elyunquensis]